MTLEQLLRGIAVGAVPASALAGQTVFGVRYAGKLGLAPRSIKERGPRLVNLLAVASGSSFSPGTTAIRPKKTSGVVQGGSTVRRYGRRTLTEPV